MCIIEFGTRADKDFFHPLGEALLLVVQRGPFGAIHHRFDAGEHFGIEKNLGPMACQNRRDLALDLLQSLVGFCAGQVPEDFVDLE